MNVTFRRVVSRKPNENWIHNQSQLDVLIREDKASHRVCEVGNAFPDLAGADRFKTLGDVGMEVGDVDVPELPDTRLPDAKDELDRVAFRRVRGV